MVEVGAAAGGDGDVVETSGHQRVKDALWTGRGNRDGVKCPVTVAQGHQVTVHLTCSRTPRHAEEVHPPVVTNRDLTHCSRDWGKRGKRGRRGEVRDVCGRHLFVSPQCLVCLV